MMLKTSNKTSSYKKALIKKGYYPGKLLRVEPFVDSDGKLKESKYGNQLIFEYAIYKPVEEGIPTEPMMFEGEPVKLSKFVYHMYKNKDGTLATAITPKSAITKLLITLGWTFTENDVDVESFIGQWSELNVDDYTNTNDETYSSIDKVSKLNIVEMPKDSEVAKNKTPITEDDSVKIKAKLAELEELNKQGNLSDTGLADAKEQFEARLKELE